MKITSGNNIEISQKLFTKVHLRFVGFSECVRLSKVKTGSHKSLCQSMSLQSGWLGYALPEGMQSERPSRRGQRRDIMLPAEYDITGKVAFITGAGRGIGKGIAQAPAAAPDVANDAAVVDAPPRPDEKPCGCQP